MFVQSSRSFPIYEKILLQSEERYPYRLPFMGTFKVKDTRWLKSLVKFLRTDSSILFHDLFQSFHVFLHFCGSHKSDIPSLSLHHNVRTLSTQLLTCSRIKLFTSGSPAYSSSMISLASCSSIPASLHAFTNVSSSDGCFLPRNIAGTDC